MFHDDDDPDAIRKQSERRVQQSRDQERRTAERATQHATRQRIVAILSEAELSEVAIRARLSRNRRGNEHHVRHHLRMLSTCRLIGHDDSNPPLYRLI